MRRNRRHPAAARPRQPGKPPVPTIRNAVATSPRCTSRVLARRIIDEIRVIATGRNRNAGQVCKPFDRQRWPAGERMIVRRDGALRVFQQTEAREAFLAFDPLAECRLQDASVQLIKHAQHANRTDVHDNKRRKRCHMLHECRHRDGGHVHDLCGSLSWSAGRIPRPGCTSRQSRHGVTVSASTGSSLHAARTLRTGTVTPACRAGAGPSRAAVSLADAALQPPLRRPHRCLMLRHAIAFQSDFKKARSARDAHTVNVRLERCPEPRVQVNS